MFWCTSEFIQLLYDAAHAHASHRQASTVFLMRLLYGSHHAHSKPPQCLLVPVILVLTDLLLSLKSMPFWSESYIIFFRYAFWQILAMALFWNLLVCTLWWTVLSWSFFSFFFSLTDLDNDLRASQRGFLSWLHVLKEFLLGQKGYFQNVPTL